jgi:gliding motility-associated-like protein
VLFSLLTVFSIARAQIPNLPPVVDKGIPNQHVKVDDANFSFTLSSSVFRDIDSPVLTYTAEAVQPSGWPSGIFFNASEKRFYGMPSSVGSYHIKVIAVDPQLQNAETDFWLTVHSGYYAAFTMDVQKACGSQYVQFINKSDVGSGASYHWNFGNGNTSTLPNPIANYTSPGTYPVLLTVTTATNTYTFTDHVTIYPLPVPAIVSDPEDGCEPLDVSLTSTGSSPNGTVAYYRWYSNQFPGQNEYYSIEDTISFTNLPNRMYTVDLTVTDENGCVGTFKQDLFEVYDNPVDSFTFVKDKSCEPSRTVFTRTSQIEGSSIQTVVWNVDGQISTNPREPYEFNFTSSGDHIVTLTTTSSKGCDSEPFKDTVRFNNNNSASFTVNPATTCLGSPTKFVDNGSSTIVTRNWDFDNNGSPDEIEVDSMWIYQNEGTYTPILTATFNDGCIMTVQRDAYVEDINANFNYSYRGDCNENMELTLKDVSQAALGGSLSRTWYLKRGMLAWEKLSETIANVVITPLTPENYEVSLVVSNASCKDSMNQTIIIAPSRIDNINVSGTINGCAPGGLTHFTAIYTSAYDPAAQFEWDFDFDGTDNYDPTPTTNTTSHTYNDAGEYSVKVRVTTQNGCSYVLTKDSAVQLATPPTLDEVQLIQSNSCYSTGIQLKVHVPDGVDSLLFSIPPPDTTIMVTSLNTPYHDFFYHFKNIGNFDIEVIAIDNGCASDVYTVSDIQINGPKALFDTEKSSFCNVTTVNFDNLSSNNSGATTNYTWDFDDDSTSNLISPSHHYDSARTYMVTLSAEDTVSRCKDDFQKNITLYTLDEDDDIIDATPDTICASREVTFRLNEEQFSSNFSIESIVWDFKDGTTFASDNLLPVKHIFTRPGNYAVSISVVGAGGACTFESTMSTPLNVRGPIVDFYYSPEPACLGAIISFINQSRKIPGDLGVHQNFEWDFGDGNKETIGSPEHVTHTYLNDTIYTVSLKVTDSNGCFASDTAINMIDIKSFSAGFIADQSSCDSTIVTFRNQSIGDGLTYNWNFGDGEKLSTQDTVFTHTYDSTRIYQVTLEVFAPGGCSKTDTQTISVINITADFVADEVNIGCAPAEATFIPTATGADVLGYTWSFGDDLTSNDPIHTYYTPGLYTVSLVVRFANGCTKSSLPKVDYIHVDGAYGELDYDTTPKCSPNEVTFTLREMRDVDSIKWDFGNGFGLGYPIAPTITHDTTYTYTGAGFTKPSVVLSSAVCGSYSYEKFGVTYDLDKKIYTSVPPTPIMGIDNRDICQGVPITFTDESTLNPNDTIPITNWHWTFLPGSTSTMDSVQFAYPSWGSYEPKLIVSNRLGCTDSISERVTIYNIENATSSFNADDLLPCPNQSVNFNGFGNSSNGPITSWFWNFGDGTTATTRNFDHAFDDSQRGKLLNVFFVATDDKQCSDSTFHTVAINNLQAVPDFDPQLVYRDSPVGFFDVSTSDFGTSVIARTWTFETATPGTSTQQNQADVRFPTIGENVRVTLEVRNNNLCTDDTTFFLNVLNNPPIAEDFMVQFFEGINYTFVPDSFAANYSDIDGQALNRIQIATLPVDGKLYLGGIEVTRPIEIPYNQIGLLKYHPGVWHETTSFQWMGFDGTDSSNVATVTIIVLEEPEPPVPQNFTIEVAENEVAWISYADFVANIVNETFPLFPLDSIQIVTLPLSARSELIFNGAPVDEFAKYSKENLETDSFAVELPSGYNEGSVSFQWNGFDSYSWGTSPAIVTIVYVNKPPQLDSIVRTGLKEDSVQTITQANFESYYSDADAHDTISTFLLRIPSGTYGTFRINGDASITSIPFNMLTSITYTPRAGGNDDVVIEWGASDGQDTTYATIRFEYENTPPVANNVNLSGTEDTPLLFSVQAVKNAFLNGFSDIDNNDKPVKIRITSLPLSTNGNLTLFATNPVDVGNEYYYTAPAPLLSNLRFTPATDWNGIASFTYIIFDGTAWSEDTATVWITINPVNDPPVAVNDTINTQEDTPTSLFNIRSNDWDIDDLFDSLRVSVLDGGTAEEKGAIELQPNGDLIYTPDRDSSGEVSFTYNLCDPDDSCTTATVFITVGAVNDPPAATDDEISILETIGTYISSDTTNLLYNDIDPEGDAKEVVLAGGVAPGIPVDGFYGRITVEANGNYTYTLNAGIDSLKQGEIVTDSFPYTVADQPAGDNASAWLIINIIGVNSPPTPFNDFISVDENAIIDFNPAFTLLLNDTDPEDDPLHVSAVDGDSSGSLYDTDKGYIQWLSDGQFRYQQGEDNTMFDELPEGDTIQVLYTYTVSDGDTTSDGKLIITINGKNDPPIAVNDYLEYDIYRDTMNVKSTEEGSLLLNDDDPDYPHQLTIVSINNDVSRIATGSVGILKWPENFSGAYTYIPNQDSIIKLQEGQFAEDIFTYIITDEHGATDTATLTITIKGKNDNPLSEDDFLDIWEDDTITFVPAPGLLENDSDPENDPVVIAINNQNSGTIPGKYGVLEWDSTGAYTYHSDPAIVNPFPKDSVFTDRFIYRMKDIYDAESFSSLYVRITGQNDVPVALDNVESIFEGEILERLTRETGLLNNDSDIDLYDAISVITVDESVINESQGTFGILNWSADGTYTYTLNAETDTLSIGEAVIDTFEYQIQDLHDSTAIANLIIHITGKNSNPVAVNDWIDVMEDDTVIAYRQPYELLLRNDYDVDGDTIWMVTMKNQPLDSVQLTYCSITWDSTGAYTYYRNPELDTLSIGTEILDSVQYRITDTNGTTADAWLYIRITGENDAPVAVRDNNSLLETTASIASNEQTNLLALDTDIDQNDSISVIMVANDTLAQTPGIYGELRWNSNGSYTYLNDSVATDSLYQGEVVYDIFPYTISDREGATASESLWIEITGVNDKPVALNDTLRVGENDASGILTNGTDGLRDNDWDIDDDELVVINFANAAQNIYPTTYGTISWNNLGTVQFMPSQIAVDTLQEGESVFEDFRYVVSDSYTSDTAWLTVIITGVNDVPRALNDSVSIFEDTDSVTGSASDFSSLLNNDEDLDNDSIFISLINNLPDKITYGDYGRVEWDSLGNYTYYTFREITDTLAQDEIVFDVFEYTLTDAFGATTNASLVITIIGINDPPIANENTYRTRDRIPITVAPPDTTNILYNDIDVDSDVLTMTDATETAITVTDGEYGVLNWNSDGSFDYYPDSAFAEAIRPADSVIVTFTYIMEDDYQAADTSLLYFIIEGINNPPIAKNDTLLVFEDDISKQLADPGLLIPKNVHDPDRDTLEVSAFNSLTTDSVAGRLGYIRWDSAGKVVYFPYQDKIHQLGYGEAETDKFSYSISDEEFTSNASLIVKIIGENDPVIAFNDTLTIDEDTYGRINVVANDYDIDFDEEGNFDYSSLKITLEPLNGKASRNSVTGEIYYKPYDNFFGKDSLLYRICDTGDSVFCDEAWLYIEVTPVNDPPVATHLVLETPMNTPVDFDYAAQVTDVDDGINPTSLELPANNKVVKNGDSIRYTPATDFSGIDEFIYSMKDFSGAAAFVIVTVMVGDTASDFRAQNDTIVLSEDTSVDIDVLANDTLGFEFPDPRSVQVKVFPTNGVATFDPIKQVITYQPDENFNGTDSLTYIVSSGPGNWSFARVIITVEPVNDPFVANDDYAETKVNVPVSIDISANDSDPDSRIDELSVVTPPLHGSAVVVSYGVIRYIPNTGFTGIDTLMYSVCDTLPETQECDSAFVIIITTPIEKEFEAQNDYYTTDENTPKALVPLPIDNDENVVDQNIVIAHESFSIISGPLHGSYHLLNDTVVYTPETGYFGPDWMQYIVADTAGNWDMAEINLWVNEVNSPPIAANDTAMVTRNEFKRIFVLENDYDKDGTLDWATLKIEPANGPTNGEAKIDVNTGTILYKPNINSGDDHFTYRVCDNKGACVEASVYVSIELDTTIYIYRTINEDTPVTIDLMTELQKYNFSFAISSTREELKPELGKWALGNNNQNLTYTPLPDSNGTDAFRLNVCSAEGQCAYLRFFIKILPVNDAPVAIADTLHWLNAPDTLVVSFNNILRNDFDVDGDTLLLTQSIIDQGYNDLHIEFNSTDSTITITADTIYWCDAWFTYEIKDRDGKSDTAKVLIWPPLERITAYDDRDTVNENSLSNRIDVLANDDFVDNQRCTIDTVIIITPPQHGTAIGTLDNFVVYAPTRHYYGADSLEYRIVDRYGQASSAWIFIDVLQKNSPPVAVADTFSSDFGAKVTIPVLLNDYDPDAIDLPNSPGDPAAYIDSSRTHLVVGVDPLYGTVEFDYSTFSFTYTHGLIGCDDDYFEYTIYDNEGDSATASVTIALPDEATFTLRTDTVRTYPGVPVEVEPLLNDEGYFIPQIIDYTNPFFGSVSISNNVVTYQPNPEFMDRDSMIYTVGSECGNEGSAYIIFIIEKLRVPEIITPNGDGKNDVVIIDGIEYFPDNLFQIYNRYGHIVYQKKRYDNTWGGYSNKGSLFGDKPLPAGTYYYTLTYNEGRNRQAGFIYIFR